MKKLSIVLVSLSCLIFVGATLSAYADTVYMKGQGIAWDSEWGPNYNYQNVKDVPIDIQFRLVAKGLTPHWEVDIVINGFGFKKTYVMDGGKNGDLYADPNNQYVHVWANDCWGGEGCDPDPANPQAEGGYNMDILLNLLTAKGYMNLGNWSNDSTKSTHFKFQGEADLFIK